MSGKNKKATEENQAETQEKIVETSPPEPVKNPVKEMPIKKNSQIPAKLFINNLKVKLAKEKVSESLYIAFLSSVQRVDTEANYQKIWDTTFKRK